MQVTINIPDSIIKVCSQCGWNEEQTIQVFTQYLKEITQHPYNHFELDFENWINEDDIQDILPPS